MYVISGFDGDIHWHPLAMAASNGFTPWIQWRRPVAIFLFNTIISLYNYQSNESCVLLKAGPLKRRKTRKKEGKINI